MQERLPSTIRATRQDIGLLAGIDTTRSRGDMPADDYQAARRQEWAKRFNKDETRGASLEVHIALVGDLRVGYVVVGREAEIVRVQEIVINPKYENTPQVFEALGRAAGIDEVQVTPVPYRTPVTVS